MRAEFFADLTWKPDRMLLGDLVFRLEHYRSDDWELGDDCFVFYKIKKLVDQYEAFWNGRSNYEVNNILEVGMWDGGSVAFWFELFQPEKHVALDIAQCCDSDYFLRYVTTREIADQISTYWGTDATDAERLQYIVANEFATPLDLVLDDASHQYAATKSTFEFLFPFLRPGGLYIIEDWAWAHWPEFLAQNPSWVPKPALTNLVFELIEAAGSSPALISSITVYEGFAVIERGVQPLKTGERLQIAEHISRLFPQQRNSEQLTQQGRLTRLMKNLRPKFS